MRNGDTAGKRHPDTVDCFAQSSFFEAFPGIEEPKMKRFTLYHDDKCVFGFEQTFHNLKAKEDPRYKDRPVSMGQFWAATSTQASKRAFWTLKKVSRYPTWS